MSNFINNANNFLSENDKDITNGNSSPLVKAFLNKLPIDNLYDCALNPTSNTGAGYYRQLGQKIFPDMPKPQKIHVTSPAGLEKVSKEGRLENLQLKGQNFS